MYRTRKELTDVEIIDLFEWMVDMICDCYNYPVRKEFQKSCRAAQIGYDIEKRLLSAQIIAPGDEHYQERMNINHE